MSWLRSRFLQSITCGLAMLPCGFIAAQNAEGISGGGGIIQIGGGSKSSDQKGDGLWLGLQLSELSDLVKEQLGIEHGVCVDKVVPDSPAAKAELKARDIITNIGDKKISKAAELLAAVNASAGKELELGYLRKGKEYTAKITPMVRPGVLAREGGLELDGLELPLNASELETKVRAQVEQAMKAMKEKLGKSGEGFDLEMLGPGIIVESRAAHKMPEDLQISISKQGNAPAKISVKQKDKTWDITENELDKLPDDIRPHVKSMLGATTISTDGKLLFKSLEGETGGIGAAIKEKMNEARQKAEALRNNRDSKEQQLKRIEAEMEKLKMQIEKLKQSGGTNSLQMKNLKERLSKLQLASTQSFGSQSPGDRSPGDQQQTPAPLSNGGFSSVEAFATGISITDGNGTRTNSRSGVKSSSSNNGQ